MCALVKWSCALPLSFPRKKLIRMGEAGQAREGESITPLLGGGTGDNVAAPPKLINSLPALSEDASYLNQATSYLGSCFSHYSVECSGKDSCNSLSGHPHELLRSTSENDGSSPVSVCVSPGARCSTSSESPTSGANSPSAESTETPSQASNAIVTSNWLGINFKADARNIQQASASASFLPKKSLRTEDQMRYCSEQYQRLAEDKYQKSVNHENLQKKRADIVSGLEQARSKLEESHSRVNKVGWSMGHWNWTWKSERSLVEGSSAIQKRRQELNEFKEILKCKACNDRPKEEQGNESVRHAQQASDPTISNLSTYEGMITWNRQ
ncbi:hypothetical protein Bca4012_081251 [Brassica carinata]